ncbi:endo-1,4-beta-xylanase [Trifolium repens]|nr:endo-1,4-beta-xylanase [Trifolium repens]
MHNNQTHLHATIGFEAEALSYDYSAIIECLAHPQKPLYNGGIIENPELNDGLKGWTTFGDAKIEHRESLGNKYVIAHSRNQPHDSVSQKIHLQKGLHYSLSAWIQVSEADVPVTAMSNTTSAEIWIDNISLQPFTEKEWSSHQEQSIEKARKRKVLVQAIDEQGRPLQNASVNVTMNRLGFPFGSAINKNILSNSAYHNWFTPRFTVTTFEDEMKWYTNEYAPGKENYYEADEMLQYAKKHDIFVRGHNVFWDDPRYQPNWVTSLSPSQLNTAVQRRVNSIVQRYKGQLIG